LSRQEDPLPPDVDLDKEERDPAAEEEEDTARREYAAELARREKELAQASREMPALSAPDKDGEDKQVRREVSTQEVEVDESALVHMLEEDEEGEGEEVLSDLRPRVLVIEGDTVFATEISNELAANGFAAKVIPDGKEVIKNASAYSPAMILLCVELPGLSGYLVCNQLKQHPELKKIPLILMSAEATTDTFKQHKKLATRADGYLTKPFQHDLLLKKVAALTSQQAITPPGVEDDEEAAAPATRDRVGEGGKGMDTWLLLVLAVVVLAGAVVAVYFLVF
jgi:CheY-like chemotaxis protein